jgi:hypothetical protein
MYVCTWENVYKRLEILQILIQGYLFLKDNDVKGFPFIKWLQLVGREIVSVEGGNKKWNIPGLHPCPSYQNENLTYSTYYIKGSNFFGFIVTE